MRLLWTDAVTECFQFLRWPQPVTRNVPEIQSHHPFHENRVKSWSAVDSDDGWVWCCSTEDTLPTGDSDPVFTPVDSVPSKTRSCNVVPVLNTASGCLPLVAFRPCCTVGVGRSAKAFSRF